MNLHTMLSARADAGQPARVGLIGAGKFGTMFLAQIRRIEGMHLVGIADLNAVRARQNYLGAGCSREQCAARQFAEKGPDGAIRIIDDVEDLIKNWWLEVVIDATGDPAAGIWHCQWPSPKASM